VLKVIFKYLESKRIKQLEEENENLHTEIAHQSLDIDHLKEQRQEHERFLLEANAAYARLEILEKNEERF